MPASAQQCCSMHLLCIVKRQLTICFKSLKPIQIGLCMLMSLSIHLCGLHLDAQYGQTWHLSTQMQSFICCIVCMTFCTTLLLLPANICSSARFGVVVFVQSWGCRREGSCAIVPMCLLYVSVGQLSVDIMKFWEEVCLVRNSQLDLWLIRFCLWIPNFFHRCC